MRLAFGQQFISAFIATGLALGLAGPATLAAVGMEHAGLLLALGTLCTAVPITVFMRLIQRAGPTRAALAGYLAPAMAVLLGVVVLGESVALHQLIGAAIILIGVALASGATPDPAAERRIIRGSASGESR